MKARFEMRVLFTTRLDLDHATRCKVHGSIARMVEKHGGNRGGGGGKFTRACGFARPRYLRIRVRGLDEVSISFV